MNKETEIIEIIERAKTRLEQSLDFYYKNSKNENIKNHFWSNIGLEINDVKNEKALKLNIFDLCNKCNYLMNGDK